MCHYNRKNALKSLTLLDLYDIIISYFIKERSILRDIKKMGVFKDLINKFKDLINNFIEPRKEDRSFDELAADAGITNEQDLKALKETMNGVSWAKFARESDEKPKTSRTRLRVKEKVKISEKEKSPKNSTKGIERE